MRNTTYPSPTTRHIDLLSDTQISTKISATPTFRCISTISEYTFFYIKLLTFLLTQQASTYWYHHTCMENTKMQSQCNPSKGSRLAPVLELRIKQTRINNRLTRFISKTTCLETSSAWQRLSGLFKSRTIFHYYVQATNFTCIFVY